MCNGLQQRATAETKIAALLVIESIIQRAYGEAKSELRRDLATTHIPPLMKAAILLLEEAASQPAPLTLQVLRTLAELTSFLPGPMRPFRDNLERHSLALLWQSDLDLRCAAVGLLSRLPRVVGAKYQAEAWTATCQQLLGGLHDILDVLFSELVSEDDAWQHGRASLGHTRPVGWPNLAELGSDALLAAVHALVDALCNLLR